MKTMELKEAEGELLEQIAQLAEQIWHEHYDALLGTDQVNYMVEHFQSLPAMRRQIKEEGYCYRGVIAQGCLCGYVATVRRPDPLFLSKLYLHARARGAHLATRILEQLKKEARSCGGRIVLTVNRYNANSIAVYRHLGFHCIREEKTPIGGGYFMDDYIMALDCGQGE